MLHRGDTVGFLRAELISSRQTAPQATGYTLNTHKRTPWWLGVSMKVNVIVSYSLRTTVAFLLLCKLLSPTPKSQPLLSHNNFFTLEKYFTLSNKNFTKAYVIKYIHLISNFSSITIYSVWNLGLFYWSQCWYTCRNWRKAHSQIFNSSESFSFHSHVVSV